MTLSFPTRRSSDLNARPILGQSGVGERARDPDDQRFGARLIVGREAAGVRTVEVEHADQSIGRDDRHDEFAAACGIAGDMTAKGVDRLDQLGRGACWGRVWPYG